MVSWSAFTKKMLLVLGYTPPNYKEFIALFSIIRSKYNIYT